MLDLPSNTDAEEQDSLRVVPRFELRPELEERIPEIAQEFGITRLTARIILGRGVCGLNDIRTYLAPSLRDGLPSPFTMKNIGAAAEIVLAAVEGRERITVYHDFDVDGLTAGAQILLYLRAMGADVDAFTPNRFTQGYGLVKGAVDALARAGTKLLIAVDCGTTSHKEIALAKRLGLNTVVIDHHQLQGEPPCEAMVNPEQDGCPFKPYKLCAAGLAWMFLIVLRRLSEERQKAAPGAKPLPDPKDFLDLAAIGTICDMVPLVGVNRIIAYRGLEAISRTKRPGLAALRDACGYIANTKVPATAVCFGLGPRLNAAGRMSSAREAFELLVTESVEEAKQLAQLISGHNSERRAIEDDVKRSCIRMVESNPDVASQPAFALFGKNFHVGVVGIVAQRIVEQFHRPAAVMGPGEGVVGSDIRPVIKGSIRSISGFHVAEALDALAPFLLAHGGHAEAGGFTLLYENLEAFQQGFIEEARKRLTPEMLIRKVSIDAEVQLTEVTYDLTEELQRLAPFGIGNPSPVLMMNNARIVSLTSLPDNHLKLRLSDGTSSITALAWGKAGHKLLRKGERINVAFVPELSTYQGITSVQLNIREVWR